MTKLLNLESYTDFCRYTQIFKAKFPVNNSGIPIRYKNFLTEYRNHPFLQSPVLLNDFPDSLTSRSEALIPHTLGIELDDQKTDDLVIVRDIDVLSLRSLGGRYLYSSAYRYWNFVSQLKDLAQIDKPIVIYDLDSLACPYYLPISFENHPNCSYPIPILDTRTVENHDKLKPSFHNSNIYDSICKNIAQIIILSNSNFTDSNFTEIQISAIAEYLKRIDIFKILQTNLSDGSNTQNLSILIEISQPDSSLTYLPAILNVQDVERILVDTIPIEELRQITQQHPQYNFILISQYNCFPSFRSSLENYFFLPDITRPEFTHIWQQKQLSQNFPLYGQYLDQISFKVGEDWIDVPSEIDYQANGIIYEGASQTQEFIGKYRKGDQIIDEFKMDTRSAQLPIKINGKVVFKEEKEQAYQLTNLFFDKNPEIKVQIHFLIRLGYPPNLKVEDENHHLINCEFVDMKEVVLKGFLSLKDITESRDYKSNLKINSLYKLDISRLEYYLLELRKFSSLENLTHLEQQIRNTSTLIHQTRGQKDRGQGTDLMNIQYEDRDSVINLRNIFQNSGLYKFAETILKLLNSFSNSDFHKVKVITEGVFFLGKTYIYSREIGEDLLLKFFDRSYLQKISKCKQNTNEKLKIMDEYFRFLSRVASTSKLQLAYFNLFSEELDYGEAYISDVYLWGYSRVLLWYSNFDYDNYINYSVHAQKIIERLMKVAPRINIITKYNRDEENKNYQYKQNAFLSLILLLTFRTKNRKFFDENSSDFTNAQELIKKIEDRGERIILRAVSETKTLTQIYSDFLNQVETSQDIESIKKIE